MLWMKGFLVFIHHFYCLLMVTYLHSHNPFINCLSFFVHHASRDA